MFPGRAGDGVKGRPRALFDAAGHGRMAGEVGRGLATNFGTVAGDKRFEKPRLRGGNQRATVRSAPGLCP